MTLDEVEAGLRARLEALPAAARTELLYVFMLPTSRAEGIGEFWSYPLIDAMGRLGVVERRKAGPRMNLVFEYPCSKG